MKPTAQDILQRCKDIVEGNYPENGREVYQAGAIFTITYNLFSVSIQEGSGDSSFERAAFLLGMDSEPAPAPEIVLEWVEHVGYPSEFYGKTTAAYNHHLSAEILTIGNIRLPRILLDGSILYEDVHENEVGFSEKWCADTIKAIVTQNPKP